MRWLGRYWELSSAKHVQPLTTKNLVDLKQPLIEGLACAALQSGLRSILVFDSSAAMLRMVTGLWAEMLSVTTGQVVKQIYLGPIDTEESLWGNLSLDSKYDDHPFAWRPGLLGSPEEEFLRVVVIPDLSRLSLAAARACIALMGSEVAHLERHGHQASWRSRLCWIAGCERSQVKFLSPHLLDRFALRLEGRELVGSDRTQALRDWFGRVEEPQGITMLSSELRDRLQGAMQIRPEISDAAYDRGIAYFSEPGRQGLRRELALLRLAQAQGQLAGVDRVMPQEVDRAAALIGLTPPIIQSKPKPLHPKPAEAPRPSSQSAPLPELLPPTPSLESPKPEPVYRSDGETTFPSSPLDVGPPQDPYPEDKTPTEREAASLRLPPRRFRIATIGRGAIVGVEPATIPQDIAWVSTLLEAAKYQGIRASGNDLRLVLRASDLRRYRRAIVPEQLLMVVLDHTCLRECQWQNALLPYLQWAYVERASVCLVQVGVEGKDLQAQKMTAQSILVPRIRSGLEQGKGMGTPLAHGLDLALQTLRHALQHGRSTVHQAVLVVVSDGRGNIPLDDSRKNQKPRTPVKRRGIEDALDVAGQLRLLKSVEAVVLNPQPKHYADLPVKLAIALGAKIEAIPLLPPAWEVDEP